MRKPEHNAPGPVIGKLADSYKSYDLRLLPRPFRYALAVVAVLVLALVASVGVSVYKYVQNPPLTEKQQAALKVADKAARGFDEKSRAYSFTQLNSALKFAYDKKCADARTVYEDVAKHPNGIPATEMKAYSAKIDTLCSTK